MSLIESIQKYDLEAVKSALQSGADVNTVGEHGWTALIWAVARNQNSVLSFLLSSPNIDVNLRTNNGGCVLHFALYNRVSQKNQKSEFCFVTNPSGFHRLDEPPEKISAL